MMRTLLFTGLCFFLLPVAWKGFGQDRPGRTAHPARLPKSVSVVPPGYAIACLQQADSLADLLPENQPGRLVQMLDKALEAKNDSLAARIHLKIGEFYGHSRQFMDAQEQYLAALRIGNATGDTMCAIRSLIRIGTINRSLQNYTSSQAYLEQGRRLAESAGQKLLLSEVHDHLGLSCLEQDDYESAGHFFLSAIGMLDSVKDRAAIIRIRSNLGNLYERMGKHDEALALFQRLAADVDTSWHGLVGLIYTRMAHNYYLRGQYNPSLAFNMLALKARCAGSLAIDINSSLINVGGDYYRLGKADSGSLYLDPGMKQAGIRDRKNLVSNGYRHLYEYYLQARDYRKALEYLEQFSRVKEELGKERYRNNIAILEAYQQLQHTQLTGNTIARQLQVQELKLRTDRYQSAIIKTLTGMAALSVILLLAYLVTARRTWRKMHELHLRLIAESRERETAERQAREREIQYKFIMENSVDFFTRFNPRLERIYASPSSVMVYGYEPAEILRKSPYDLTHPDYHAAAERVLKETLEMRAPRGITYRAIKKDGSHFWAESILNPLFDPITGMFKGAVGVTRDIQERKTKELQIMEGTKQKENLLKEIHHRVKNNFAILVSLINMQMGQTKNPELLQSLTNLQLRIRAMALVHEMLYRSGDFEKISFSGYLQTLASVIAGTYNRREIELSIESAEMSMDIETLIPLGLIINELIANAYKHAFPDGRKGRIDIRFTSTGEEGACSFLLRDDGVGMPAGKQPSEHTTMGMQVVHLLCTQIEANLEFSGPPGTTVSIRFQPR